MSTVTVSKARIPGAKTFDRLKARLLDLLKQGMQPRQLALALALGATIGLLPTVWGTSVLCILFAWLLRLNQVVVQLANYLVYPLQILLFIPYFHLGENLFGSNHLPDNLDLFLTNLQSDPLLVLDQYWQTNLQAACAWLLSLPLLMACSYPVAKLLLRRLHPAESSH
jgi:uncharacterized protein (DUF2062 family)